MSVPSHGLLHPNLHERLLSLNFQRRPLTAPKLRPRKRSVLCCLCLFVGGFSCSSSFLDHTGFVSKTPFPLSPSLASSKALALSITIGPRHSLCPSGATVLSQCLPVPGSPLCSWPLGFPFSCDLSYRLKGSLNVFYPIFLCVLQQEDF